MSEVEENLIIDRFINANPDHPLTLKLQIFLERTMRFQTQAELTSRIVSEIRKQILEIKEK